MKIRLGQTYSFHQMGLRNYQEDSRYPDDDKPDLGQRFFLVCDGVGGCDKGEVASQTVCEAFGKALENTDFDSGFSNEDFSRVLDSAYNALDTKADENNKEMATTLTFICFHQGGCTMAHIGDSRIYQIRPSAGIVYRSEDHSMVNSMVHNGILTPEQAINHPQGNVITRYMEPVSPDGNRCLATVFSTKTIATGDYFFLCSDGVIKNLSDHDLFEILSSNENTQTKMTKIAEKSRNSEDNNTAFLIPVEEVISDLMPSFEGTDMSEDNSRTTKKIKVLQNMEEIESVQASPTTINKLSNWIINLFK